MQSSAIVLSGNAAVDAYFAGNSTMDGSAAKPYVLQNKIIAASTGGNRNCITLTNTNRYITIRNCSLNASNVVTNRGTIDFQNVTHVYVTLCRISSNRFGVRLVDSNSNTFFKNNITSTSYAFSITTSTGNSIYMNAIVNSNTGSATCASTGNLWDNGASGNYWSHYQQENPTATHNGVYWTTPYRIAGAANATDTRPLVRSPFVVNVAPRLTAPFVTPGTGYQNTQFTFQITYTDVNNDAPMRVSVVVGGATQAMSKVNAADYIYTDGCLYRYVGFLQPGSHQYYFTCSDGLANTTRSYGPINVGLSNSQPPRLTNANATPATGDENTVFTFRVMYTDQDNNAPASITVTIDGAAHSMTKEDPSDTNLMNGCWYKYTTTLGAGSHAFSMQCTDGVNSNSTSTMQGPIVTLSAGAQAAHLAIAIMIPVAIVAGCVVIFAVLVLNHDKLPRKLQRIVPDKRAFSSAKYKIRTYFSDLAFKIKHRH
ncbi:MAG: NosD domain-containing protein [Candidatus Sigynarchaeota archaeon]